MQMDWRNGILVLAVAAGLTPFAGRAQAQQTTMVMHATATKTYTGVVGDDMCGVKHSMGGSDADCTRMCVKGGSNYALIVGEKAYTLDTSDKKALATLGKLAGKKVVVTGTLKGDTLTVRSVAAPLTR